MRQRKKKHSYLSGNFAPIQQTRPLTPCTYTGVIPEELVGGQYVRNGGNPFTNGDLGRDAHWFDGDGVLSGVLFARSGHDKRTVQPEFVSNFVLTDVYISAALNPSLRTPILPSIATLVNPASTFLLIVSRILRAILLVILSHLPGSQQAIKKISVANTAVLYHDGRALATCESGPPMRVTLPELETVGWFNGRTAEGEPGHGSEVAVLGGNGILGFVKEWTTGHPRVDPTTSEMIAFHNSFLAPYVRYSVIPAIQKADPALQLHQAGSFHSFVPGVASAKMMHDFGVSKNHTIIMDLPLSLDPLNQLKGKPVVLYDRTKPSRFGVLPRHRPNEVRWFETVACCIFHTANSWDEYDSQGRLTAVNLLACRQTSASVVFKAGDIQAIPQPVGSSKRRWKAKPCKTKYGTMDEEARGCLSSEDRNLTKDVHRQPPQDGPHDPLLPGSTGSQSLDEEDQCRLYYYSFDLSSPDTVNTISSQYALSAISFEFPSVRPELEMSSARYVYGCSTSTEAFGAALGAAVKIDTIVKIDVQALIERGKAHPPPSITGCLDTRTVTEILASQDPNDPIRCFKMPFGWYAQEPRFVPRRTATSSQTLEEDDGFLLFYAFDESQLDGDGECLPDARSELWILDAKSMKNVVGKVLLPQRVPYGLHGNWFPADQILSQRPVEAYRTLSGRDEEGGKGPLWRTWMYFRHLMQVCLA